MTTLADIGEGSIGEFGLGDYQLLKAGAAGGGSTTVGVPTVVHNPDESVQGEASTTAVAIQRIVAAETVSGEATIEAAITIREKARASEQLVTEEPTGIPEDVAYPVGFDSTGDVETVSGTEFYEQHALLLGASAIETELGRPLTANDITEIESRVERRYSQSPYFAQPVRVTVTEAREEGIDLRIRLGAEEDVAIPITQRDVETIQL